jgi:hypothetical protein
MLHLPSRCVDAEFVPRRNQFPRRRLSPSLLQRFPDVDLGMMQNVALPRQDYQDFRGHRVRELVEPDAVSELVLTLGLAPGSGCVVGDRRLRLGLPAPPFRVERRLYRRNIS